MQVETPLQPVSLYFLLMMAVVAAFFPWVSFSLNDLDTQPWFLILAGLYLALTLTKLRRGYGEIWFFMLGAIGFLTVLHEGDARHTIRGLSTYISASR